MRKPLNAIQKRIFDFSRLYKNDPSYNLTFLFVIEGPFDSDRFLGIAKRIADSVEIARSRIVSQDNTHFLVRDGHGDSSNVVRKNWENLTRSQFLEEVRKIGESKLNTAIDVTKPLRLNIEIHKNTPEIHALITHFSHILADAYSFYHVISLFQDFYNSDMSYEDMEAALRDDSLGKFFSIDAAPIIKPTSADFFTKEIGDLKTLEMSKIKQKRNSEGVVEGHGCTFKINAPTSHSIRDFIKTHDATEFSFFLAVYVILLSRLTEQNSVVFGLPVANRTQANMNVFGCYVNTLPLKMTLEKDMPFSELCKKAFGKALSIMRHQGFDIGTLDKGKLGYVNNAFTYYKQELGVRLKGCSVTRIPLKNTSLMFDFLGRVESGDDFTINLEYGKSLADAPFEKIYHALIDQCLANKKLGDIRLYKDVSEEYAETNAYRKANINHVADVFRDTAERYPDQIAVKFQDTEWSYKKLSGVSDSVAHVINQNFQDAKRIALSCHRGPELIAIILGIIKSGKSYVPIDVNSPARRIEYILADAGNIPYVVEDDMLSALTGMDKAGVLPVSVLMSQVWDSRSEHQTSNMGHQTLNTGHQTSNTGHQSLESELYVIYTSGSTGDPKGVPVSNRNLMSLLEAARLHYDFDNQDIWSFFHSYGFDVSVFEIFGCLLSGGKLIVVDSVAAKSPEQFYKLVSQENVTVLSQTPTAFKGVINADSKYLLPLSLRYVIFAGEKLNFNMLTEWIKHHDPNAPKLINMYGITEVTIHATFYTVTRDDILFNSKSIIGKPLSNLEFYLVDQDLNVLPKGLEGEILVCGDGVVNGYHNKGDLTHKKFIDIPGSKLEGIGSLKNNGIKKAYRSGDLAKITTSGDLEYMGRMDAQVQLRGFRVELGEVESVIMKEYHDSHVRNCTVQMMELNGHDQLIAFVVSGCPLPHKREIKQRLKNVLPEYMIPVEFIHINDIPMTLNGKINLAELKRTLPDLRESDQQDLSLTQGSPALAQGDFTDERERYIFDVISHILNSRDFSLDDNFFDIGVTSVHIPDIYDKISRVYEFGGFDMIDLFEYTTVRKLAKFIKGREEEKEAPSRAGLRKSGLESRRREIQGRTK
ncbi:MAG: amino acid adenylation domain-containing protein [Peptococcaceae bacterium]|nr:amino acid adenylation domain-containing protein [Peptococcaceae bacterium]